MRVPILAPLEKNDRGGKIFPATDADARICMTAADGPAPVTTAVDVVECRDMEATGNAVTFWLDTAEDWQVTVTDSRILFWNPASKGLFGKPKVKPGKASGGQMRFSAITNLSAFHDRSGRRVLLCICRRADRAKTAVSMVGDEQAMRTLFDALYAALDRYTLASGSRLTPQSSENSPKILEAWEQYPQKVWADPAAEAAVFVPSTSYEVVPNSRMEE